MAAECLGEGEGVGISRLEGDFLHQEVALAQQIARGVETKLVAVAAGRNAVTVLEQSSEMCGSHSRPGGYCRQSARSGVMGIKIIVGADFRGSHRRGAGQLLSAQNTCNKREQLQDAQVEIQDRYGAG